ncbi:DNA-binding protein [Klebsiella oxytoca]|uniref:ParB/RepB/Spo0J family partition protein n=1 Tax=Klebsiella oxytoca TaxID=571 RepID=UPI001CCD8DFB|nr:DNA-binding protein [Klebsiella oxytoca]MBZ7265224.1 DNA-binding protein [Klebsiella oxytoca]
MTISLGQYYKSEETGTTVKKTYQVPLNEIYIEPGYNVREINQDHVIEFRDAFIAGEFVPPLAVEVTENGVKVIDGHHRYKGALAACEAGHEIARLECKDFTGSEADKIAFMITSSQGMPLSPVERGLAYLRLSNQGWSNGEIAKKVKRSESDIIQHMQLMECSPYVQKLVREGRLNYALAIELHRKHGIRTDSAVAKMMEKAEGSGKKKITRAVAQPQFPAKKARRFTELFKEAEITGEGEFICLRVPAALHEEIDSLLSEIREESNNEVA